MGIIKSLIGAAAVLIVISAAGCRELTSEMGSQSLSYHADTAVNGVRIMNYDSDRKPVELYFNQPPKRVLVYGRNNIETMLALGLGNSIEMAIIDPESEAYRELSGKYPEEIRKIRHTAVGEVNLEEALSANPDFILAWKSTFTDKYLRTTRWWQERGVNTYIVPTSNKTVPQGTIEDECAYLQDMGKIFHVEEKTNHYINQIRDTLKKDQEEIWGRPKPKVMVIELNQRAIMNYDDHWIVGDMVEQLHGNMPVQSSRISQEELITEDPDVIFVVTYDSSTMGGFQFLTKDVRFQSMKAVKEGRVYPIRLDMMYTPSIKTPEALRLIRDGLYPDLAGEP